MRSSRFGSDALAKTTPIQGTWPHQSGLRIHYWAIFVTNFPDVSVCTTLFLLRIFLTFLFARSYFCHGFFGRFCLHFVILSWIFRTFQFARSFCCGFFGRFSLRDVVFVADFSDVSVCTMLFFSHVSVCTLFFSDISVCTTLFLSRIFHAKSVKKCRLRNMAKFITPL